MPGNKYATNTCQASHLPARLLYLVLESMDSETQVVELLDISPVERALRHGYAQDDSGARCPPTHAVIDADGDSVGCGLSVAAATADAILRAYNRSVGAYDELREAVLAKRSAERVLEGLV